MKTEHNITSDSFEFDYTEENRYRKMHTFWHIMDSTAMKSFSDDALNGAGDVSFLCQGAAV